MRSWWQWVRGEDDVVATPPGIPTPPPAVNYDTGDSYGWEVEEDLLKLEFDLSKDYTERVDEESYDSFNVLGYAIYSHQMELVKRIIVRANHTEDLKKQCFSYTKYDWEEGNFTPEELAAKAAQCDCFGDAEKCDIRDCSDLILPDCRLYRLITRWEERVAKARRAVLCMIWGLEIDKNVCQMIAKKVWKTRFEDVWD
jgi:hypothetical protein